MSRKIVLLVAGLALMSVSALFAQDVVLGQKYGQGVHAYFTGDYRAAYEHLTSAIDGGSKDPRVFYFRGLSYLKLGRPQEASLDFQKGAELESNDVNKFYNVSKSLERVQGSGRAKLENYRIDARMAVMEQAEKLRKARYEAIQREESRVVRQMPAPPEAFESSEPVATPVPEPSAKSTDANPFAAPAAETEQKPADARKGGVLGAMGKALGKAVGGEGERPSAEDKKAADDPFAAPAAGEKKPAIEEKPADEGNPFDEPAAEPAAEEEPAKTDEAADKAESGNPFE